MVGFIQNQASPPRACRLVNPRRARPVGEALDHVERGEALGMPRDARQPRISTAIGLAVGVGERFAPLLILVREARVC